MIKKILHKFLGTHPNAMSFHEGLNLTGQPVVTFNQGNTKINFILDTGSTHCVIDKSALDFIDHTKINLQATQYGLEGNTEKVNMCIIKMSYKEKDYEYPYLVKDMSKALTQLKESSGVTVHGLLGSNFFNDFKYVLDFKELIAYSKE